MQQEKEKAKELVYKKLILSLDEDKEEEQVETIEMKRKKLLINME